MIKVTPTTKDQLVYYLLTNISLGTYDRRFLNNIQTIQLVNDKPVTSNQSDLLDKIILRYARQLAKKELSADDMVLLSWKNQPLTSLPEFTEARISIKDNEIILNSPYKTTFVKEFKEYQYSTWDKDARAWSCPLSEETLRYIVEITGRHYDAVNYSVEVREALNTATTYSDAKYWNPTLIEANGMLYVAACNNYLYEAIKDIDLVADLATIARLVHHGVAISDEVKLTLAQNGISEKKIAFASERVHRLEYDATLVLSSILSINPDFVLMSEWYGVNKTFTEDIKNGLAAANIETRVLDRLTDTKVNLREFELPIVLSSLSFISSSGLAALAAKTISLVNSNPITIK
jgi:hypothetical protein